MLKPVSEEGLTIHFAKSPGLLLSKRDSEGYRTHILNLPTSPESSACDFFNYTSQTTRKIQRIWNSPKDVLMTYKHSWRFAKVAKYSIFACPLHFITRLLCQKREFWQPVSNDFAYLLLEPCPHYGHNPCNQNSDRSDWEKWSTAKGGPVLRNFSSWTEWIHWVLDQNFQKFRLNGSCPINYLGKGLICFYVGVGVGRRRFCKRVSLEYTVELWCNEPRYNKVLGITNNLPYPSNSKIYGKEPRYNETSV